MLNRYALLLVFICPTLLAQPCSDLIGTTTEGNGVTIFAFKEGINVTKRKGKEGISIYGCVIDSAVAVIFTVTFNASCIQQGTAIHVTFSDGTRLKLTNLHPDNCEQKSMVYFASVLNNRDQLELLKNRPLKTLKIWTSPSDFVSVDMPALATLRLRESLKCLSKYIGVKPPPVTASVSGSEGAQMAP